MENRYFKIIFFLTILIGANNAVMAQTDCGISCPNEDVVATDPENEDYFIPDFFENGTIGYSLDCAGGEFTQTPEPGTVLDTGQYEVTVQITFDGETTSCTFNLVVEPDNPGDGKCVITCPEILVVEPDSIGVYTLPDFFEEELIFVGGCDLSESLQKPEAGTEFTADSIEVFLNYTIDGLSELCSFIVVVDDVNGIDNPKTIALNMYPNPSFEEVNFEVDGKIEEISIHDVTGTHVLTTTTAPVDVTALQTGLYLVKVTTDKGMALKRLVVK